MIQTAEKIQFGNEDYTAVKSRQQGAWASGDYGKVGVTLQVTGEMLCEAMDLRAGQSVLDVAAGNGNATLAAARRFCKVSSTDYVPALLEQSARHAAAEGFDIDFRAADAEDLPFADASFDNVVSTFGVMFTPDQRRAAAELVRVCKPGGKIGLANWTPEGFIGQLFKTIGRYVAPPPGVNSPAAWGTEDFLREAFAASTSRVDIAQRSFVFRYRSPVHWLEVFGTFYGPVLKVMENIDPARLKDFRAEVLELIGRFNHAEDGTMVVPSSYLEVVVTR